MIGRRNVDNFDFGGRKSADRVCEILAQSFETGSAEHFAAMFREEQFREKIGFLISSEISAYFVEQLKPGGKLDAFFKEQLSGTQPAKISATPSADRASRFNQSGSGASDSDSSQSGND